MHLCLVFSIFIQPDHYHRKKKSRKIGEKRNKMLLQRRDEWEVWAYGPKGGEGDASGAGTALAAHAEATVEQIFPAAPTGVQNGAGSAWRTAAHGEDPYWNNGKVWGGTVIGWLLSPIPHSPCVFQGWQGRGVAREGVKLSLGEKEGRGEGGVSGFAFVSHNSNLFN